LKKAFTNNADFSGITKDTSLMINAIKHKTYIKIDEENTEASAATFVSVLTGSARSPKIELFKADHPFIFMIIDNKTNGILFLGRYETPDK
jgi:serpin B